MKQYYLILIWMLLLQTVFCCIYVKLDEGVIKGRILNNRVVNNEIFYAFQEIPYAAPPLGNLRFQPPQPVPKWNGILDTTKNTKICYQVTSNSSRETEDCLYLNVYTPKLPSKHTPELLPVMFFIHGGSYSIGSGTYGACGPEFLIRNDVVIVTINYRLGVFGFLSTQDEVLPGNNGLKDQLFALQWVRKNIHLFGGDSLKITIFGQSAGASSVGYHLVSNKSRGLFRAAIMESSSALSPFGYQRNARSYAFKIAALINSSITEENTSNDVLNIMREAPAEDIDAASSIISSQETYDNAQLFQGYFYAPVIEPTSEHAFLTEKMYETIKNGDASRVPIIIGINSEESISPTTDLDFLRRLMSLYDNDPKGLVPNDMNIENDARKTEAGERIRTLYSGQSSMQTDPASGVKYMSDTSFTRAVIKHALLQSKFSDVYFYQFSYDGKMGNVSVIVPGTDRVGHNEELAYIWCSSNNYDLSIFPTSDITTQNRILTLWTTFAKTLNPTPKKLDLLQNITWPIVQIENNFSYLNIDENLSIKYYPKQYTFDGWVSIYEEFGVEPFDTY